MLSQKNPKPVGLYHPAFEHDACGTGFVASIDGIASHAIVQSSLQCVCNVTHRGAVSADAKTGDGAGILTQIPQKLFAKALSQLKAPATAAGDLAVGVIFLPKDKAVSSKAQRMVEEAIRADGMSFLGWRSVPVNPAVLGDQALETLPAILHALIGRPSSIAAEEFERHLFLTRRRIEQAWEREKLSDCYIPSFSSRTIAYKGLLVAPQLAQFYRDLSDTDYTSAISVFHQRYSTNTFPNWFLAQPFRFLGHNGEINTLQGNRNWMAAREPELSSKLLGSHLKDLFPIVQPNGSDSMSLDNVLELFVMSGRDILQAMMMLVPDAWQGMRDFDIEPHVRAFYQYHAMLVEPWDGPAALAFTDGEIVGATLDRNGLRPARYWVTQDRQVIMASEVGVVNIEPAKIVEKGRLGPGQIFAVDTRRKRLLHSDEIKREYASAKPYQEWVAKSIVPISQIANANINDDPTTRWSAGGGLPQQQKVRTTAGGPPAADPSRWWDDVIVEPKTLMEHQIAVGMTDEEIGLIIEPMAKTGKEAVWSMGDDAPPSVLSALPKPLPTYFKQLFAQVTNPPIDPIREELVMSLHTILGARPNALEEGPAAKKLLRVTSPLLMPQEFAVIRSLRTPDLKAATLSTLWAVKESAAGLRKAVSRLREEAVKAVDGGATLLILSDRGISAEKAAVPSLLAVGAVHHHLIRESRRMKATIIVEAGDVHDVHGMACLIGYGAAAVHPYLVFQTIKSLELSGKLAPETYDQALAHYHKAIDQGVLKIMSKMGISTVGSYRGAQIFEALGLSKELIDACFTGTTSRIAGITYEHIAEEVLAWHKLAYARATPLHLEAGGFYKYRRDGEYHAFNPEMIRFLQQAIKGEGSYEIYKKFAASVNSRPPVALRDLLDIKPLGKSVPLSDVEPVEAITRRFATASISYGALSLEAHETLAIAMNRIGGKSGSGEGGEDPARYHPTDPNMNRSSAIKQVASGRFGVTPEYLMSARELEIKMAQGSKPGEGGQLPGHKVSADIARVRHTIPGISLISPPPHHDIYSIEDLAQLIYDLKMINPTARVNVKLVAEAGVGTIAAGVAKGYADTILISGYDGGTGASPLSSIKSAGLPWELGLAETQQTLRLNHLRGRVLLRADGGMKTGRDLLIAALFGAEEFGFGTAAVVATGCVMTRKCHLNTCPVGVATQDEKLRAKYTGTPESVANYMRFIAQELREYMAQLGARSLDELIGHTELLTVRKRDDLPPKAKTIDLSYLLTTIDSGSRIHTQPRNNRVGEHPLDDQILQDAKSAIEGLGKVKLSYKVKNTNRTIGARVAGAIAQRYGDKGLPIGTIDVTLRGVAGQSFGAFLISGMRLTLIGESNDYVGKGMAGGELVVRPPDESGFAWHQNSIIGNTCLYGATGGVLYAAGRVGERFAVRNSGAVAVVEGLGDHGCEYMTGGIVLVLGETGRNFGAGMTGGRAYVLDKDRIFDKRINLELVELHRLEAADDVDNVRTLLERHFVATKSNRALAILTNWEDHQELFWVVIPRGLGAKLDLLVSAKEG